MNDLEIKGVDGIAGSASQLDKLKNLLIEFGVDFNQTDYESVSYIDMLSSGKMYTTAFAFTPSGKFSHISEN